jgi:hypothetical protein
MKGIRLLVCSLACVALLSACYTTETVVGHPAAPYVKAGSFKSHHLVYGLVSVANRHEAREVAGNASNYVVQHQWTFIDGLVSALTWGIYTPTTTNVFVPAQR